MTTNPLQPCIALLGCTKTKGQREGPARELYAASDLFRLALSYAELRCEGALVLSAAHGVVTLDRRLAPYQRALGELGRGAAREEWDERVTAALAGLYPVARWVVLCGAEYVDGLDARQGWTWSRPLAGMGIGQRKQWLAVQGDPQRGLFGGAP